jgi:hypothetical protein
MHYTKGGLLSSIQFWIYSILCWDMYSWILKRPDEASAVSAGGGGKTMYQLKDFDAFAAEEVCGPLDCGTLVEH